MWIAIAIFFGVIMIVMAVCFESMKKERNFWKKAAIYHHSKRTNGSPVISESILTRQMHSNG